MDSGIGVSALRTRCLSLCNQSALLGPTFSIVMRIPKPDVLAKSLEQQLVFVVISPSYCYYYSP